MAFQIIPVLVVGAVSSLGLFGFSSAARSGGEAAGALTKLLIVGGSVVAITAVIKKRL